MRITLDAGHHSGYNVSPVYKSYNEGDMTWKLTNYLRSTLETLGHEVILTRTDKKKDLPVYERGLLSKGSDLFLSIHSNASTSEKTRRVVVIPSFLNRNNEHALAEKLGSVITSAMNIQNEPCQLYTRTYKSGKNEYDYYGVIRGSVAAGCKRSIILEHSFHTNKLTCLWLSDDMNLRNLATKEAYMIASFLAKEPSVKSTSYDVGDRYLLTDKDIYTNGKKPASYAIGKEYTILKKTDSAYLLSEIVSWIKRRD